MIILPFKMQNSGIDLRTHRTGAVSLSRQEMDCATQRTKSIRISAHDHYVPNSIHFAPQTFRSLHIITIHLSVSAIYLIFAVSARWELFPVPMSFLKKKEKTKGILFLKFFLWTCQNGFCVYFNWITLGSHEQELSHHNADVWIWASQGGHLQGAYQLICQF